MTFADPMSAAARANGEPRRRSSRTLHCDVLVVGAGVVGLATALGLAQRGVRVAVLSDRAAPVWRAEDPPSRVSTLNDASSLWLAELGLMPVAASGGDREPDVSASAAPSARAGSPDAPRPTLRRVAPVLAMRVWDAQSSAAIRFDGDAERPLAFTVEHSMLESALWRAAERLGAVGRFGWRWRHFDAHPEGLSVALDPVPKPPSGADSAGRSELWRARWIVAADGARSAWRERLGIASTTIDDGTCGIVATLEPEWSHADTAYQRFDGDDIVALLPLAGERVSVVWSRPARAADAVLALARSAFDDALTAASGAALGRLATVTPPRAWPIVRHHARRYGVCHGRGGVLLAGDAAHTIHPLAGQGLNLGLADARALVERLPDALAGGWRPASLLAEYEAERRPDNALMRVSMEAFKRLFAARSPTVRGLRGLAVRGVAASHVLRAAFRAAASGRRA